MIPVVRSLSTIRTDHTVFEKNQVLTHEQLNTLSEYADDQLRLGRIKLTGVGVVSGLRVGLPSPTVVELGVGVGITTDGDLVWVDQAERFTHFKAFDAARPVYGPFWESTEGGEQLRPLWELLPEGTTDPEAQPLSGFAAAAGFALGLAAAVAYVESYHQDEDLCSGTDCDNLGQERRNPRRLLLISPKRAAALGAEPTTPHAAFAAMSPVGVMRPALSGALTGPTALWGAFAGPIRTAATALSAAVAVAYKALQPFVPGAFATDPVGGWQAALAKVSERFAPTGDRVGDPGYVYAYDWLKDLADTLSALRDAVLDDHTWLCTDPGRFPKHLLLGTVGAAVDSERLRTRFTPSPALSPTRGAVDRARFLLRKLDAQIRGFQLSPSASAPIRITPSAFEDQPLEDRSIPYYYALSVQDTTNLLYYWSQRLFRRGEAQRALSYHAASYSGDARVSTPLRYQLGALPFFRVEGHVGGKVDAVQKALEDQIQANNLSFAVETVYIGTDPARVRPRPRPFTDLHRLHRLFREDVALQLDTVNTFGGKLQTNVANKISAGQVSALAADNEGADIVGLTANRTAAIQQKVVNVKPVLKKSYSEFRKDSSWVLPMQETVTLASSLKKDLSPVAKTEFQTPIDTLVAAPQLQWVDWIGKIIDHKETKEDERWAFSRFITDHAGAEHLGGVLRGGTLILLYDEAEVVVADLALPYRCCAERAEDEDEPELTVTPFKPDILLTDAITVQPSRTKLVKDIALAETTLVRNELLSQFTPKLEAQTAVLDLLKDSSTMLTSSMTTLTNSYSTVIDSAVNKGGFTISADSLNQTDKFTSTQFTEADKKLVNELDMYTLEQQFLDKQRVVLEEKATAPTVSTQDKAALEKELAAVEAKMAESVQNMATTLSRADTTVATSAEAQKAVTTAAATMTKLPETQATAVSAAINTIAKDVKVPDVGTALNKITRR